MGRGIKGTVRARQVGQKWGSWLWAWDQQAQYFASSYKEPSLQVRGFIFTLARTTLHWISFTCLLYCVSKNNSLLLQGKNKPCYVEIEHVFILGFWTVRLWTVISLCIYCKYIAHTVYSKSIDHTLWIHCKSQSFTKWFIDVVVELYVNYCCKFEDKIETDELKMALVWTNCWQCLS
jgi:hypothetical protein